MNIFASLIRRSERRRAYENLRQLDDQPALGRLTDD